VILKVWKYCLGKYIDDLLISIGAIAKTNGQKRKTQARRAWKWAKISKPQSGNNENV